MKSLFCTLLLGSVIAANGQIVLSGSAYHQDFNQLGAGLPDGWDICQGASADTLGTPLQFNSTPTSWGKTSGGFKNFASADNAGVAATDGSSVQAQYLDRALGIRQTSSFGDPGAAFVAELANTTGRSSLGLSLDFQILNEQSRSTTWRLDYRMGSQGNFIPLGTFNDPGQFGSVRKSYSFGHALDNQPGPVFIRIAALDQSLGSGSRDAFAIDNVAINYSAVPEPAAYSLLATAFLAGYALLRRRGRRESSGLPAHGGQRI